MSQSSPAALEPVPPASLCIAGMALEEFASKLCTALVAENLAFTTYALMVIVASYGGPISVARLSIVSGMSYHATRNQLRRTSWWRTASGEVLVSITLNDEAIAKLARLNNLLAQ